ncbi:hypothetical protein LZ31DRAFT_630380 [Colletotrichum somersetense]|nr:hypothetical protein LZ31DRAFT_630380 [Colletotrichum somersetense]
MQGGSAEPAPSAAPLYPPLETFLDRRHPQPISLNLGFERFRWPAFAPLHEIKVLRDSSNAESEQNLYQVQADDGTFSLHPIASEPYTNPLISSLRTSVDILDHYDSRDTWEDLHTPLIIRANSKAYVTIGDIVSQVNKYVIDLREDVLEALDAAGEYAGERSPDHTFWVAFSVNSINIEEARSTSELNKAWKDDADAVRQFRPGMQFQEINQPLQG